MKQVKKDTHNTSSIHTYVASTCKINSYNKLNDKIMKKYNDSVTLEELQYLVGLNIEFKENGFNEIKNINGVITKVQDAPHRFGYFEVFVDENSFVLDGVTLFNLKYIDVKPSNMLLGIPKWVKIVK